MSDTYWRASCSRLVFMSGAVHLPGSSSDGWTPLVSPGSCWCCGRGFWWTPPDLHRTCSRPSGRTAPWCCCLQSRPWCSAPDAPSCRRETHIRTSTNDQGTMKHFLHCVCVFTCSWWLHVECRHSLCPHGSALGRWTGPDCDQASHLLSGTHNSQLGTDVLLYVMFDRKQLNISLLSKRFVNFYV